jgi:hypothetical protein
MAATGNALPPRKRQNENLTFKIRRLKSPQRQGGQKVLKPGFIF